MTNQSDRGEFGISWRAGHLSCQLLSHCLSLGFSFGEAQPHFHDVYVIMQLPFTVIMRSSKRRVDIFVKMDLLVPF